MEGRQMAVAFRIAQAGGNSDQESAKNFKRGMDSAFPLEDAAPEKQKKGWWERRPGEE